VPIYNLNYGYISISNRQILEIIKEKPLGTLQPLDWECAGECLWMLKMAGAVSLLSILVIENNLVVVGLRPLVKPVMTHLEMIHEST
jgi:hypothetical protein